MSGVEVLGATDAVLALISRIYSAFTKIRDAPEEIRKFCDEITSLRQILVQIGISASAIQDAGEARLGPGTILAAVHSCETELKTTWRAVSQLRKDTRIKKTTALTKVSKSVAWILKSDEVGGAARGRGGRGRGRGGAGGRGGM